MKLDKNYRLKFARAIIHVVEENRGVVLQRLTNQFRILLEREINMNLNLPDCKITMYLMNDKTFIKFEFENCVCLVCVFGFLTTYKWYQYKRFVYGNYQHGNDNKRQITGGGQ